MFRPPCDVPEIPAELVDESKRTLRKVLIKTYGFFGFDPSPEYNNIDRIEAALAGRGVWIWRLGDMPRSAHGATGRRDDLPTIKRLRGKVGLLPAVHGEDRQDAIDRAKRLLDTLGIDRHAV
jgi:hypothetical protein